MALDTPHSARPSKLPPKAVNAAALDFSEALAGLEEGSVEALPVQGPPEQLVPGMMEPGREAFTQGPIPSGAQLAGVQAEDVSLPGVRRGADGKLQIEVSPGEYRTAEGRVKDMAESFTGLAKEMGVELAASLPQSGLGAAGAVVGMVAFGPLGAAGLGGAGILIGGLFNQNISNWLRQFASMPPRDQDVVGDFILPFLGAGIGPAKFMMRRGISPNAISGAGTLIEEASKRNAAVGVEGALTKESLNILEEIRPGIAQEVYALEKVGMTRLEATERVLEKVHTERAAVDTARSAIDEVAPRPIGGVEEGLPSINQALEASKRRSEDFLSKVYSDIDLVHSIPKQDAEPLLRNLAERINSFRGVDSPRVIDLDNLGLVRREVSPGVFESIEIPPSIRPAVETYLNIKNAWSRPVSEKGFGRLGNTAPVQSIGPGSFPSATAGLQPVQAGPATRSLSLSEIQKDRTFLDTLSKRDKGSRGPENVLFGEMADDLRGWEDGYVSGKLSQAFPDLSDQYVQAKAGYHRAQEILKPLIQKTAQDPDQVVGLMKGMSTKELVNIKSVMMETPSGEMAWNKLSRSYMEDMMSVFSQGKIQGNKVAALEEMIGIGKRESLSEAQKMMRDRIEAVFGEEAVEAGEKLAVLSKRAINIDAKDLPHSPVIKQITRFLVSGKYSAYRAFSFLEASVGRNPAVLSDVTKIVFRGRMDELAQSGLDPLRLNRIMRALDGSPGTQADFLRHVKRLKAQSTLSPAAGAGAGAVMRATQPEDIEE